MDDKITYDNTKIISSQFFIHRTSITKDKMMQAFNCHLYDYKITIVHNHMDNDDMVFQCDYQMIIFKHGN
jgi:hypothetical protein